MRRSLDCNDSAVGNPRGTLQSRHPTCLHAIVTELREIDDETLLTRWRTGDNKAGATLVERYFPLLMRFFRNKVRIVDDAKELVGETMLACTKGKGTVAGQSVRKYVFGVAMNKLREHYRRGAKRAREEADFSEICVGNFDAPGSPATIVARKREVALLVRALRRLPLEQQIVLELSYFEGLRAPEISALTDIPVPTVYTRLRRGRDRLGEQVRELSESAEVARSTIVGLDTWAGQVREQLQTPT